MKDWLVSVALTKAVKRIVQLTVAYVTSLQLQKYGLDLTVNPEALTAAIYGGFEVARNYLKVKFNLGFL